LTNTAQKRGTRIAIKTTVVFSKFSVFTIVKIRVVDHRKSIGRKRIISNGGWETLHSVTQLLDSSQVAQDVNPKYYGGCRNSSVLNSTEKFVTVVQTIQKHCAMNSNTAVASKY